MGMLSAEELGLELGFRPKTLKEWAASGQIPGYKAPGRKKAPWRFDLEEVKAALRHRPTVVSLQQQAQQFVASARARAAAKKVRVA